MFNSRFPTVQDCLFVAGAALLLIVAAAASVIYLAPSDYESDHWHTAQFEWDAPSLQVRDHFRPFGVSDEREVPDQRKTPGATYAEATLKKIKQPNYSKSVRNVTEAMHKEIFADYGIPWGKHAEYEDDHLIPLSLGGSNANENRWPQPRKGEWSSLVKDNLEKRALKLVRVGDWDLKETQKAFATDWITLYKKAFPGEQPREAMIEDSEQ